MAKPFIQLLLVSVVSLAALGALAHGDSGHADKRTFDAARVEVTAFGQEGDPRKVTRTIKLAMADTMRFTPSHITVRRGQTVRFVVANEGRMLHEMVLGRPEDLERHAALMKKFPGMEHDEPNMAHVRPGTSGQIVWRFTKPGLYEFACLIPGHFEAGMVGSIDVR